jgi:protein phosphatase 2C family protein 2/3
MSAVVAKHRGEREYLEEFVDVCESEAYYAVYDGHRGTTCSMWCLENMRNLLKLHEVPLSRLQSHCNAKMIEADTAFQKSKVSYDYSAAAVNIVHVRKNKIVCVNLGHARSVLASKRTVTDLSNDDIPQREDETKRILAGDHYFYKGDMSAIRTSRCLGDFHYKRGTKPVVLNKPSVVVETFNPARDHFILTGSHGVFAASTSEELIRRVYALLRTATPLQEIVQSVNTEMAKMGGHNCSLIITPLTKEGETDAQWRRRMVTV